MNDYIPPALELELYYYELWETLYQELNTTQEGANNG